MYAAPAPAYYPPPVPAPAGPTVITVGNQGGSDGSPCLTCGRDTPSMPRKKIGGVAIAWFCCLLWTVGAYGLCLIPLCTDSCKDTELICLKCQTVKQTISANCF